MRIQTPFEEKLNALTHAIGAVLSIAGLGLLMMFDNNKTPYSSFSIIVYAVCNFILFTASTLYHSIQEPKKKHFFRIIDHIGIYLIIAGTYTPVCLIALEKGLGWQLFYIEWIIAAFGIVLKVFYTGRLNFFSVMLYLVMGWLVVLDFTTFANFAGPDGVVLIVTGGILFTLGIVFYAIESIPFNHVIWHLFVLVGVICHFLMLLLHVV